MTRRQQTVLGVLGALILALLVTLLAVSSDGGDDKVSAGSTTTAFTSSTRSSSTTSTTIAPTSSVTTATTVAGTPAGGPSTTAANPVVTGRGAVLRGPGAPDVRARPPNADCDVLADPGWTATCTDFSEGQWVAVAMVETRTLPNSKTAQRAYVFRNTDPGQWTVVLRALDDNGERFRSVRFRIERVRSLQVAFGFTSADAAASLAVDLVEVPGTVVVHRDLARGRARVSTGQLDTWRSLTPGGSTYAHEVIQYRDGAWKIVSSENVRGSDVPPSQL